MTNAKQTRTQLLVGIMNKTRSASAKTQYEFMVPLSKASRQRLEKVSKTVKVQNKRIVY